MTKKYPSLGCSSNPCILCNIPLAKAGNTVALVGFFITLTVVMFWLLLMGITESWAKTSRYDTNERYSMMIEENRNHHRFSTFSKKKYMEVQLTIYVSGFLLAFLNIITDGLLYFLTNHQVVASLTWFAARLLWMIFLITETIVNIIDFIEMEMMPIEVKSRRMWRSTQTELGMLIFIYIICLLVDLYFTWVIGVYIRFLRVETKRMKMELRAIGPLIRKGGDKTTKGAFVVAVTDSHVDSSNYSGLAVRSTIAETSRMSSLGTGSSLSSEPPVYNPNDFSSGSRTPLQSVQTKTSN